jgi:hypothetical protein
MPHIFFLFTIHTKKCIHVWDLIWDNLVLQIKTAIPVFLYRHKTKRWLYMDMIYFFTKLLNNLFHNTKFRIL